jgi:nitrite reductase/ring-hydroxylating ferredoxin subunit
MGSKAKSIFFLIISIVFAFIGSSCKKEDDSQVPFVAVDITLNLDLPDNVPLLNPGGWLQITGGSRGIIIYRINLEEFVAFDRHCTFEAEKGCKITVSSESNVTAIDNQCCNSVFSIIDGFAQSGNAKRQLKEYNTSFNGTNIVRIFN